jgi:hypothetical protein
VQPKLVWLHLLRKHFGVDNTNQQGRTNKWQFKARTRLVLAWLSQVRPGSPRIRQAQSLGLSAEAEPARLGQPLSDPGTKAYRTNANLRFTMQFVEVTKPWWPTQRC